jgi:Ribbon-helix-helix protein, copG family
VAQDGEAMKPKKSSRPRAGNAKWPVGKPIPDFGTAEEEDAFWGSFSFADVMDAYGEKPRTRPRRSPQARKAREHVYRVRMDDAERAALQRMAERRGVSASVIIRELVRAQWMRLRRDKQLEQ